MAIDDKKNGLLTAKQMAEACGITFRHFKKLPVSPVEEGKKGQAHYYAFSDVMRAWHRYQVDQNITTGENNEIIDRDYEEARKARADADARELKNAIIRREYAPINDMETVLAQLAGSIDGVLSSIPLNIKRRFPEIRAGELGLIEREIIRAQNKCAEIRPDWDKI